MLRLNAHNNARARETRARANVLRQCFWGATTLVAPIPKAIAERVITFLPKGLSFWG